jgi:Winged helix DNA-binding domain
VPAAEELKDLVGVRLASQLLTGPPARSPEAVVDRLLAVQAQDGRGARLGVRARSSGLVAADVDWALSVKRSLVVSWLNRGTLHLAAAEDYWWLHALTTPKLAVGNERRLRQEGVSAAQAERGVAVVAEAVISDGPQTRAQLRHRLDEAGVPTAGQALVHILFAASLRAHLVRGPLIGTEHGYVSAAAWLGGRPSSLDRDEALPVLARRYLAGHGPAGPADLAKWAGITIRDARLGFASIADELVTVGDDLVVVAGRPAPMSSTPPRLLGAFDELLHGWASREPFVGPHIGVVTTNGIFRPVVLVEGRVVATWSLPDGVVSIRSLERIPAGALDALVTEGADVLRFLGLPDKPVVVV